MIEKTKPEFVLSLNRHVDMPGRFVIWWTAGSVPRGEALGHRRQNRQRSRGLRRKEERLGLCAHVLPV